LFVGFSAVSYWRLSGRVLVTRFLLLSVMGGLLVAVAPHLPLVSLLAVAGALFALVASETLATPEPVVANSVPGKHA
jgi:hypothetical protein